MALVLTTTTNPGSATWEDIGTLVTGSSDFVVWRTGFVTSPPVYGTFADAHAAAVVKRDATNTPITIYCYGDANDDVTIEDANTYDMNRIQLVGLTNGGSAGIVTVRVPDLTVFEEWWLACKYITLIHTGASALCTLLTTFGTPTQNMVMGPSASFGCLTGPGTGIVFAFSGDGVATIEMLDKTSWFAGDGGLVLDLADTVTVEVQMLGNRTEIEADIITGDAATALNIELSGSSSAEAQVGYLGTLTLTARGTPYFASNLVDWAGVNPATVQEALDRIASAVGPIPA